MRHPQASGLPSPGQAWHAAGRPPHDMPPPPKRWLTPNHQRDHQTDQPTNKQTNKERKCAGPSGDPHKGLGSLINRHRPFLSWPIIPRDLLAIHISLLLPYLRLLKPVHRRALFLPKTCRKPVCHLKVRRMELTKEELIDALSLTRERVRVWVCENLDL